MRKYLRIVSDSQAEKILRFLNYIIDYAVVYLIFIGIAFFAAILTYVDITFLYEIMDKYSNVNRWTDYLVTNTVYFLYIFCAENFTKGRSLGKYITGTKVIMIDGTTPTPKDFLIRNLSRIVPFDGLSFLGSLGWHDNWSETRVVKIKKLNELQQKQIDIDSLGQKEIA